MSTERARVADATLTTVEERIAELLRWRRWYRKSRWADWPDIRREHDLELRALLRLAREARRTAAYADWTEGELAEAFGK